MPSARLAAGQEVPGGRRPSFAQCFAVVDRTSVEPALDTVALLRWLVFGALVGNADGHAKNLSLLRAVDGRQKLAPFYDLLCTAAYPSIATRLAMQVGQTDDPGQIRGRDWRQVAEAIGVTTGYVVALVRNMAESLPSLGAKVAREMAESYGRLPAAEMILPVLRKRSRRTLQLLRK